MGEWGGGKRTGGTLKREDSDCRGESRVANLASLGVPSEELTARRKGNKRGEGA